MTNHQSPGMNSHSERAPLPAGVVVQYRVMDEHFEHGNSHYFDTAAEAGAFKEILDRAVAINTSLPEWQYDRSDVSLFRVRGTDLYFVRHPVQAVEQFFDDFRALVVRSYSPAGGLMPLPEVLTIIDSMWSAKVRIGESNPTPGSGSDVRARVLYALRGVHIGLSKLFERLQSLEDNGIEFIGGVPSVEPDSLRVVELDHPLVDRLRANGENG